MKKRRKMSKPKLKKAEIGNLLYIFKISQERGFFPYPKPPRSVILPGEIGRLEEKGCVRVEKLEIRKNFEGLKGIERHRAALENLRVKITEEGLKALEEAGAIERIPSMFN